MKFRAFTCIFAMTLFGALVIPVRLAAQHTRYKLIDLGTLGGPTSQVNGSPPPMINDKGVVAGEADKSTPCSYLGGFVSGSCCWPFPMAGPPSLRPIT